ncbi:amastin-like surface protein-like protein [Leishmania tarentolae]|uniref:Amastin-like surface protein-like protein n=1 Tax=Leishmania tarentolae TaxID=5689 RepID=A0A640KMR7_LEITA|nr:amastin-like surface protein-like protein [Leishmania tarentolae]
MGCCSRFIGSLIFTIIQLCVLLSVIISTPISQIDSKASKLCYTFWGMKSDCSKTTYSLKGKLAFGNCAQRRDSMNGGAAFAIISIFTTLVALLFGLLMVIRNPCAVFFPLLFTCISVFTILISWACVAGALNIKMCGIKWSLFALEYGAGFGLMVVAFCLQIINVLLLMFIFRCC